MQAREQHAGLLRNQLLLIYGTSAAIGLQAGLVYFFLTGLPRVIFTFTGWGLILGSVVIALWWWVFPRLPGKSEAGRIAWAAVTAGALISVVTFAVTQLGAWAFYGLSAFRPYTGNDVAITLSADFLRYAPLAAALVPVVPTVLMAVLGYRRYLTPMLALETRARELHELAASAQLAALRAQIHPHFLFNSLNSIAQLVRTDPDEAEACIERLAEIFRYLTRQADRDFVPLADELDVGDAYLDIQRARFRDNLRVEKRVDQRTLRHLIPNLILQPLVENAIRHGISRKVGPGTVTIETGIDDGHLVLRVTDDGIGMGPETLATAFERGVGLRSIRDRLARLYGPDVRPEITSTPHRGTSVVLRLPVGGAADEAPTGRMSEAASRPRESASRSQKAVES
jgi:signal transduction histidine kinase